MPKDEELSPGKKSAQTKGPKKLRKAARRAADTRAIRSAVAQATKSLAAAVAKLDLVQKALEKIDSSAKPGKRPPKKKG
ncbi:MAG: hypothetical protein WAM82_15475 [Thermoanaerobaculia bacterium]